jgi:hypothetical protein
LTQDGHDAIHLFEVGMMTAADDAIMAWAVRERRCCSGCRRIAPLV